MAGDTDKLNGGSAAAAPEGIASPAGEPSDAELVDLAREGDTEAYEALVRRHQSRLYGIVYHMTGHREDAQDLVQAAFVRAYRSLNKFRGQAAFYTWLYRIAVNLTLNFLKRRRRAPSLSLDDLDQGVERDPGYVELVARESPVREVSLGELQRRLNEAMLKLSDNHRAVVAMFDVQGMSHEEIARVLGISEGTVRSRLFYARRQLQKDLAEFVP